MHIFTHSASCLVKVDVINPSADMNHFFSSFKDTVAYSDTSSSFPVTVLSVSVMLVQLLMSKVCRLKAAAVVLHFTGKTTEKGSHTLLTNNELVFLLL